MARKKLTRRSFIGKATVGFAGAAVSLNSVNAFAGPLREVWITSHPRPR